MNGKHQHAGTATFHGSSRTSSPFLRRDLRTGDRSRCLRSAGPGARRLGGVGEDGGVFHRGKPRRIMWQYHGAKHPWQMRQSRCDRAHVGAYARCFCWCKMVLFFSLSHSPLIHIAFRQVLLCQSTTRPARTRPMCPNCMYPSITNKLNTPFILLSLRSIRARLAAGLVN